MGVDAGVDGVVIAVVDGLVGDTWLIRLLQKHTETEKMENFHEMIFFHITEWSFSN